MAINTRENPTAERINESSIGSAVLESLRAQLRTLACALAVSTPFLVAGCSNPNQQQAVPAVDAERAQNAVSNSVALWLCETILDEIKQENWERKQADIKTHVAMLGQSLKDSNLKISDMAGKLNEEIDKKADREFIRKTIEEILEELKKQVEALASEELQIDQRVEGVEKLFGYFPTVPPSPLLRTSLEGEPEAHPLTVKWMKLLSESEIHRIKLEELNRIYRPNAPEMQQAMAQFEKLQQDASALHLEVKVEMAKKLLSRTKLLVTMKETHPEIQNFDRNISSLAWLVAITKPAAEGRYRGTLEVPEDLVGPSGSDIVAAFQISGFKPDDVAPLYRKLVRMMPQFSPEETKIQIILKGNENYDFLESTKKAKVDLENARLALFDLPLSENFAKTEEKFLPLAERAHVLHKQVKDLQGQLSTLLEDHSNLSPEVIELEKKKASLLTALEKLNNEINTLVNAAIKDYVQNLETLRPSNLDMIAFNRRVIQPAQDLFETSQCFDWKNQVSRDETWIRMQTYPVSAGVLDTHRYDKKPEPPNVAPAAMKVDPKLLIERYRQDLLFGEAKVRRDAARELTKIGNESILPLLRERLNMESDKDAEAAIAIAVIKISKGKDIEAIALIKDRIRSIPRRADEILLIKEFALLFKDEIAGYSISRFDENLTHVVEVLGPDIATIEIRNKLIEILKETSYTTKPDVTMTTIRALIATGHPTQKECSLIEAAYIEQKGAILSDDYDIEYAKLLGKIGPNARNNTKCLYKMLDGSPEVKKAAQEALKKILEEK